MSFATLVTAATLAKHLDDPAWAVCDCRFSLADPGGGERAYREDHIPGARYVHLERDLSAPVTAASGRHPLPEREVLAAKLGAWGITRDSQVVAYDDADGAFAARLWWLLRWLGHGEVAVLDGGWGYWLKQGYAKTARADPARPAVFRTGPPLTGCVSAGEVRDGMARQSIFVVDARSPERFRGEAEPIDALAGHVPGAVNRPFKDNLAADGRFLPRDELRRQFSRRIAPYSPEHVVHMCGSGVTACHNLLAMEAAGLSGSRLYAGSWSEWIRDPARPVATAAE
jgi:thiosulfate/3-mercaptopyruvate sulfurtransferase